jgi:hypothetical protein
MSMSSYRVWIMALCAVIISLAAIALSAYSVTKGIQAAPSVTSTSVSFGQKFNWSVDEVVDVKGRAIRISRLELLYISQHIWNRRSAAEQTIPT